MFQGKHLSSRNRLSCASKSVKWIWKKKLKHNSVVKTKTTSSLAKKVFRLEPLAHIILSFAGPLAEYPFSFVSSLPARCWGWDYVVRNRWVPPEEVKKFVSFFVPQECVQDLTKIVPQECVKDQTKKIKISGRYNVHENLYFELSENQTLYPEFTFCEKKMMCQFTPGHCSFTTIDGKTVSPQHILSLPKPLVTIPQPFAEFSNRPVASPSDCMFLCYRPLPIAISRIFLDIPTIRSKEINGREYLCHLYNLARTFLWKSEDFNIDLVQWYAQTLPSLKGHDGHLKEHFQPTILVNDMKIDQAIWFYGEEFKNARDWKALHFGLCESKELQMVHSLDILQALQNRCLLEANLMLRTRSIDDLIQVLQDHWHRFSNSDLEFIFQHLDLKSIKIADLKNGVSFLIFLATKEYDITPWIRQWDFQQLQSFIERLTPSGGNLALRSLLLSALNHIRKIPELLNRIIEKSRLVYLFIPIPSNNWETRPSYEGWPYEEWSGENNLEMLFDLMIDAIDRQDRTLLASIFGCYEESLEFNA